MKKDKKKFRCGVELLRNAHSWAQWQKSAKIRMKKFVKFDHSCARISLTNFEYEYDQKRKFCEYPENMKIRELTSKELIFGGFLNKFLESRCVAGC